MNGDIFDSNELDSVKDVVRKCTNVCILVDYDNLTYCATSNRLCENL
jgi:hypothetical protein|nr:MAG TPA: hypothetical protein [Caudoviricetes sp.]